jgi:pyruvate carboxylase
VISAAGKREVFFEANGVPRVVEVVDERANATLGKKAVREKAEVDVLGSVGAPMAGTVVDVQVRSVNCYSFFHSPLFYSGGRF